MSCVSAVDHRLRLHLSSQITRAGHCAQELYTGSNDCQIVVWGARDQASAEADTAEGGMDEDAWSD